MLNPFSFLLKNKKKSVVISLIMVVAVLCIYSVSTLINSVYTTCSDANVSIFSYLSIASVSNGTQNISENTLSEIKNIDGVKRVFITKSVPINIKTIFGTTSSYIFFMKNKADVEDLLNLLGLSIAEGKTPEIDQNEIAMNKNVMKNKGLKVGDELAGYTIVGMLDGNVQISIGTQSSSNLSLSGSGASALLILPEGSNIALINSSLKSLGKNDVSFYTVDDAQKQLDDDFDSINIILLTVVIMLSFSLSFAVAALVYSIYSNRYDEFGILHAIGYKKKNIQFLILEEMLIISCFSWICGYVISLGVLYIFNDLIYTDMGQTMNLFVKSSFIYSLMVPLFVIIFAVMPTTVKLHNSDLVSIIERR